MPGNPAMDLHLIQGVGGGITVLLVTSCSETGDMHRPLQGSRAAYQVP